MNSAVPALSYPTARAKAWRRRPSRRAGPARRRATGSPRGSSGAGAGRSSRARRAASPFREHRRGAGSRRGEGARRSARRRRGRHRTRRRPHAGPNASASSSSSGARTSRMPRPPPPAAALTMRGNPTSSGSPLGTTGTPASAAIRFASSLSPAARRASRGGADEAKPGRDDRLGEARGSPRGSRTRDGRLRRRSHRRGSTIAPRVEVAGHARRPRRRAVCGMRPCRRARPRRRSRSRGGRRWRRSARRSRRGWLRGAFGSPCGRALLEERAQSVLTLGARPARRGDLAAACRPAARGRAPSRLARPRARLRGGVRRRPRPSRRDRRLRPR